MKPAQPAVAIPYQYNAPTPEEGNGYIGMEVLIPRRYGYQSATLVHIKCNVDVGLIGLQNANPIFGTRVYQDVFPGVKGVDVSQTE